jgi:hypothetical protein
MPMVYQVYVQQQRDKTERLVKEAVDGGCRCVSSRKPLRRGS